MSPTLNIAFAINEEFAGQLQILWASLFAHHEKGTLTLHVLHSGLSPRQESHLRSVAEQHHQTSQFHHIPYARVQKLPVKASFPSSVQYNRIFISEFLAPDVTRILYLDTDTIVCRNLAPLFAEDMHGCTVGAVEDLDASASCERLGIPSAEGYFNSGVLLIDVPAWNKHAISDRTQDYLISNCHDPSKWKFPDQDALNTVLHQSRHSLPLEWNVYACYRWFQPSDLSQAQRSAILHPGIIHFIGPEKPWLSDYAPPYQKL